MALTVSLIGVVVLAVGFFAVNYAQLFGTHKQAQTAIDAAALQAASDISQVTHDGLTGKVALADRLAANNNLNKPAIRSINRVLATARLDLIIAGQIGNTRLAELSAMDLRSALTDAAGLARAIDARLPEIQARAQQVYDDNSRRLGKGRRVGNLTIRLGKWVTAGNAITNIPVPSPLNLAQVDGSNSIQVGNTTYYRGQVNVPVNAAGQTFNVTFLGTGNGEALVPNNEFQAVANTEAPCLVQVLADEQVNGLATNMRETQRSILRVVATAQCGGHLINEPSGTFSMSFRGGVPDNGSNLNFDSIANIMNSTGWNAQSQGNWFKAFNGPVPVQGSGADSLGRFVRAAYRGSSTDAPNAALAAHVFDWLRTLGLRPNITAMKQALEANLRTPPSAPRTYPMANSFSLIPQAYAQTNPELLPQAAALFDMSTDMRSQEFFDQNPARYSASVANVLNYKPSAATIEETALAVAVDSKGTPVTTDGNDVGVLPAFFLNLSRFSRVCKDSFEAGQQVAAQSLEALKEPIEKAATLRADKAFLQGQIDDIKRNHPENSGAISAFEEKMKEIDAKIDENEAVINEGVRRFKRGEFTMVSADFGMHTVEAIMKNMKGLTAGGVQQISSSHFKVHGTNYLPATHAATRAEIEGDGPVTTGQNAMARIRDWTAPPKNGKCQLEFFDSEITPVAHLHLDQPSLLQPALATTSVPASGDFIFNLNVKGSAARPDRFGAGEVTLSQVNSTPFSPSVLEGQYLYQNTRAIAQTKPGKPTVYWQVMGRDHAGNPDGTFFADTTAEGFSVSPKTWCATVYGSDAGTNQITVCPALAAEFVITCPMPGGQCVSETFYVGGAWSKAGTNGFGGDERVFSVDQAKNILSLAHAVIDNPTQPRIRRFWLAVRGTVPTRSTEITLLWAYIIHFSLTQTGEFSFQWHSPKEGWLRYQGYGINMQTIPPCARISIEHG